MTSSDVAEAAPETAAASKNVGSDRLTTPLPARLAYPLAFVSGALYFLAFPGIDLWPLAFVALVPLIVALRRQPPRRAAGLGWLAGFTMTMIGFYWLVEMLKTFSGFPLPLCILFMAILCGYQAGRIALLGWLTARLERKGWPFGGAFTLAFATSELVFPLLFPWYYGATVHQVPTLAQGAELGGPILVALVLVAINFAFAHVVLSRLEHTPVRWRLLTALAAIPPVAVLYGIVRMQQVGAAMAAAPKAEVGLVQANMSLLGKRRDRNEGLRRHLTLTRQLQNEGPLDLVVWSETSVAGAVDEAQADAIYPQRFTRRLGVPTVFGAVLYRPVSDVRRYTLSNSALLSDEQGRIAGRYDKQFLLAFGEYLPLGDTFPVLYEWSPNSGRFSAGTSFEPLRLGERSIAALICYEDIVPGFVNRIMAGGEPELIVNLTNDAWFGDTTEPWIHLALSKFRAIEQRRYLVRSTNSGVSAFVDPLGQVMSHTETFEQAALREQVAWMSLGTPYQLWGDVPWWLLSAVTLVGCFVARPVRRQ